MNVPARPVSWLVSRLLWLLALGACHRAAPRPSLLLVTLDTLRADHVGAYGDRARTPNLDRFAREATVFEHVSAPMPMTRPSHFSLFTGRYPREHGVLSNALALPDSERVLAEVLHNAGYRTAAFVAVSLLDAKSGAGRGFDELDSPQDGRQRTAAEVVPRALAWLAAQPADAPSFLWVHLFDAHLPYAPAPEFRRDLDPKLAGKLPVLDLKSLHGIAAANGNDLPRAVLEHGKQLYRCEVEGLDAWVGKLLDAAAPGALTVVVADHGESFEHGVFFEHTESLGECALRLPLLVRFPPRFPPGTRVPTQASMVDVAPTILDALGLPPLPRAAGRSLVGRTAADERCVLVQHPVYSSATLANRTAMQHAMQAVAGEPTHQIGPGEDMTGVVGRGWKYLRANNGREELYRLGDDEHERAAEEPQVLAELRAELDRLLAEHPLNVIDAGELDPKALEELEDLGYAR
jgi:arylsulfatase A-like enzyme